MPRHHAAAGLQVEFEVMQGADYELACDLALGKGSAAVRAFAIESVVAAVELADREGELFAHPHSQRLPGRNLAHGERDDHCSL
jgi:hypothetical protein